MEIRPILNNILVGNLKVSIGILDSASILLLTIYNEDYLSFKTKNRLFDNAHDILDVKDNINSLILKIRIKNLDLSNIEHLVLFKVILLKNLDKINNIIREIEINIEKYVLPELNANFNVIFINNDPSERTLSLLHSSIHFLEMFNDDCDNNLDLLPNFNLFIFNAELIKKGTTLNAFCSKYKLTRSELQHALD